MNPIRIETRRRIRTRQGITRIVVTEGFAADDGLLQIVRNTPIDAYRVLTWPDKHVEVFDWTPGLQFAGPSDSRLLPEGLRREGGKWYVESGHIYWRDDQGSLNRVEVRT